MAYTLISSQTLASSAASVTFSSIPSTYKDLVLRVSARSDSAGTFTYHKITFNGSASGYSQTYIYGNGSTAGTGLTSANTEIDGYYIPRAGATASTFSSDEYYIPSYLVAQNKPLSANIIRENNTTAADIYAYAGLYSNTSTISSIAFVPNAGNYVTGSSFYLYGIN